MGQIITSVAGSLLLLKMVKLLLPEGGIKKYASFTVSALVMLIMILSVAGRLPDFKPGLSGVDAGTDTESSERLMSRQIMSEFSGRLEQDIKGAVAELSECDIEIAFSQSPDGEISVVSVQITSECEPSADTKRRIQELYGIDTGIISWRKK